MASEVLIGSAVFANVVTDLLPKLGKANNQTIKKSNALQTAISKTAQLSDQLHDYASIYDWFVPLDFFLFCSLSCSKFIVTA